ncbi:MAG: hypothetical protein J7517_12230 [Sphingobium yanoikuyae]|uniref:hypothetical protein n=1 Tax=Sphingobium yanoikuyae TaxID=13690 RepID=UPI001B1CB59E|nr:hypothetical protein [Sphingobium yanoikuyae]
MFNWLRDKLKCIRPVSSWMVTISGEAIVTTDGQGTERQLPIVDLKRVVVATDDSGPWGDDVVFLLYSDGSEPVGIFPLEADGCQDFVDWLSTLDGYKDREMAKAMSSTEVARFAVFSAES